MLFSKVSLNIWLVGGNKSTSCEWQSHKIENTLALMKVISIMCPKEWEKRALYALDINRLETKINLIYMQYRQGTYNVTLGPVRVTIVAVEKQ
jgi:hypothetical protein